MTWNGMKISAITDSRLVQIEDGLYVAPEEGSNMRVDIVYEGWVYEGQG